MVCVPTGWLSMRLVGYKSFAVHTGHEHSISGRIEVHFGSDICWKWPLYVRIFLAFRSKLRCLGSEQVLSISTAAVALKQYLGSWWAMHYPTGHKVPVDFHLPLFAHPTVVM